MKGRRIAEAGSTLVEAMIACLIVALFFASIYAGGWQSLHALKSAMEGASASQLLMNLQEQVRTATWAEITSPTYLSGTILANSTSLGHLSNVTQTILVNPYPVPYGGSPAIGSQTLEVTSSANGTVTSPCPGNGQISSQNAVRVDITVGWSTVFNRTAHTRIVSLIVSQGGVLGQN